MGRRQRNRDRSQLPGDVFDLELAEAFTDNGDTLIKIASPGWGATGYYPEDVLKRDAATAFPAGTHMYLNHPTLTEKADRPERSVLDLAGAFTENARWIENGTKGPGVYAHANILAPHRGLVEALAPHIGISLRAPGTVNQGTAEGRTGPIVKAMGKAHSVDFVTKAGRGGEIAQLMESAGLDWPELDELDEADLTYNDKRDALDTAIEDAYRGEHRFTWVRDFNDDWVVFEDYGDGAPDPGYFQANYTIDDDGTAVLGAAVKVSVRTEYVPVEGEPPAPAPDNTDDPLEEGITMPMTKEERAELIEATTAALTEALEPIKAELAEAKKETAETATANAALSESLRQSTARDHVRTIIAGVGELPAGVRERATASVLTVVPLTEAGGLDLEALTASTRTAITAEIRYLQENGVDFGGIPTGLGGAETTDLDEAALDAEMEASWRRMGLSESAAKTATTGR